MDGLKLNHGRFNFKPAIPEITHRLQIRLQTKITTVRILLLLLKKIKAGVQSGTQCNFGKKEP